MKKRKKSNNEGTVGFMLRLSEGMRNSEEKEEDEQCGFSFD